MTEWSVKDFTRLPCTTIDEANQIVDACETGSLHNHWDHTPDQPLHYVTDKGRIHADDYAEAKRMLLKAETKAEVLAEMRSGKALAASAVSRTQAAEERGRIALDAFDRHMHLHRNDYPEAVKAAHIECGFWRFSYFKSTIKRLIKAREGYE